MRRKWPIPVVAVVLALMAGAVAAYAYDSSRADVIARGVTIAGVEVGGMDGREARARIRRELRRPLGRPLVIRHRGTRFTLSAEDAGVRPDVDGMVEEALERSRDGTIVGRVVRDLTGGREDARVPARIEYSERAVRRLIARVARGLDRPARDATLDLPSLSRVSARVGIRVRRRALRRRIERALGTPAADRTLAAPVRTLQPEVTRAELADKYPVLLVADRSTFKLRLYRNLELVEEYTIAVGAIGFDTPAGLYHIQNKAVDPAWSVPQSDWAGELAGTVVPGGVPENPLKERWLGIYDGAGIHGTDQTQTLGTRASHGCIRMAIPDVVELYGEVPVGAPIYIS